MWLCPIFGVKLVETYSSMIRITSLRLLFAISAQLGLILHPMDVDTALLHADITEEIYNDLLQNSESIIRVKLIN